MFPFQAFYLFFICFAFSNSGVCSTALLERTTFLDLSKWFAWVLKTLPLSPQESWKFLKLQHSLWKCLLECKIKIIIRKKPTQKLLKAHDTWMVYFSTNFLSFSDQPDVVSMLLRKSFTFLQDASGMKIRAIKFIFVPSCGYSTSRE